MLKNFINREKEPYRSWYDLSKEETIHLEKEFTTKYMGKVANDAMHICILIGVFTFVVPSIILAISFTLNRINPYSFIVMLLLILLGIFIVVASTIEYHIKFNSWLLISKKIIKK